MWTFRRTCALGLGLVGLAPALVGCLTGDEEDESQSMGSYQVHGSLVDNTCGSAAVPASDPLVFRIELRQDGPIAIWRQPDNAWVQGVADETWEFSTRTEVPVIESDAAQGIVGCRFAQVEQIEVEAPTGEAEDDVVLDAGVDAGSDGDEESDDRAILLGQSTIQFSPTSGSDCTATLTTFGGPFEQLPCAVTYDLTLTPIADIF